MLCHALVSCQAPSPEPWEEAAFSDPLIWPRFLGLPHANAGLTWQDAPPLPGMCGVVGGGGLSRSSSPPSERAAHLHRTAAAINRKSFPPPNSHCPFPLGNMLLGGGGGHSSCFSQHCLKESSKAPWVVPPLPLLLHRFPSVFAGLESACQEGPFREGTWRPRAVCGSPPPPLLHGVPVLKSRVSQQGWGGSFPFPHQCC